MARPFIPAPNAASVELIYTSALQVYENRLHVFKGEPYTLTELQALRSLVDNWDSTSWKLARNAGSVLTRIKCRALDEVGSPVDEYQLPSPRGGTSGGAALPLSNTWCVKLVTERAGRSYRGRLYTVAMDAAMLGAGAQSVTLTFANNVVASLEALRTALDGVSQKLCIVSYMKDKSWRDTAEITAVSHITYSDLNVDSQRRRLVGRGRT